MGSSSACLRAVVVSCALLGSCAPDPYAPVPAVDGPTRDQLEAALKRGAIPDVVTYSDMSEFWGGERISVRRTGAGHAERRARGSAPPSVRDVMVSPSDLARLAALLVEVEAWKQLVRDREMMADETVAGVDIRVGDLKTGFWEWQNDADANRRLVRIRLMLEQLVPP